MTADELPEGWEVRPVGTIFKLCGGGTPYMGEPRNWGGSIPWLSSGDIKTDRITGASKCITQEGLDSSSAKLCQTGTVILVVRSGILKHTLPVAILDIPAAINQDIRALDSGNREVNEWLALALRAFSPAILEQNREGTTVQSVKTETIQNFTLPLPPLAEQRRIVAAVERIFGKVSAARARLERVPTTLKRFRQAVLAAACSGRLTADWREKNPCQQASEELLKVMSKEREQAWVKRNPGRKYRLPEEIEKEVLPEIPTSWAWTNFDHCAWEITVGHVGPMKDRYVADGVLFLRSQNVRPLRFDTGGLVKIAPDFHATLRKSALHGGEILITRSGANTGDCCVLPMGLGNANCADLVVTRSLTGLVAEYGAIYINSPEGQERIGMRETGMAQPHFNIGAMRVKAFPVPPLAEQQEIVRQVSALFARADAIEARASAALKRVESLMQAVLAKAFRGELVPTEAELARRENRPYESAGELLERIRASATAPAKPSRTRKPKVAL